MKRAPIDGADGLEKREQRAEEQPGSGLGWLEKWQPGTRGRH